MSGKRSIFTGQVASARHVQRISISAPGDFALVAKNPIAQAEAARQILLPYCLDLVSRRSIYVGGVEPAGAQAAPFYYLFLRREAKSVVSVPWEHGRLSHAGNRAPVFLFSPGRCGSTLLSRILSAAGIANVSEPDFYTQATSALCASPLNPFRATIQRAIGDMGADLAATLDPVQSPVIKLRAESCRAPDLLLQPRERRTIFLTRSFESWARSNIRAFRNPAQKSVRKYLRAMSCYAYLRANSDCYLLRYEDLSAEPLVTIRGLAQFLGHNVAPEAVAATMKEDSQAGTPLRQGARADLPGWEKRFDATMALWNSAKVRRARDRLGVDALRPG